ncbi:MAG: alkaline phosphatase D family protein, partial [Bacteroidota bacterium]
MRVTPLALALAAVSFLTAPLVLKAQPTPAYQPTPSGATNALVRDHFKQTPRASAGTTVLFDPALAPFFHGVASGDPLTDRVILWTRVTQAATGPVTVSWTIGTSFDAEVRQVTDAVNSGIVTTGPERDYTVKVDADGLAPGTTYYYQFQQAGARSIVGRTRTAPEGAVGRLRFGVAADANYQSGFFNAYEGLAARADLDAVIHLGDYIHERRPNTTTPFRPGVQPETETVTLADYRLRHGFYKLDPDARAMHQQHPLIAAWDDHESADNAYAGGAANHNEPITFDDDGNPITFAEEGDWEERKAAARRAYFEWMPLREPAPDRLYRRLAYGDLAELFMLDTRLAARDEQVPVTLDLATQSIVVDTTTWLDPDRVLLGAEQQTWLTTNLEASTAQWKVIGNQVMMVPMAPNPSWEAVGEQTGLPAFTNLDAWDGYPFERAALLRALRDGDIENVVVLSGDIHSSWAADVPLNPYATSTFAPYVGAPPYNPFTGANSVAVEFVTPSVASVPFAQ